ncbi:hypothetical protein ACF0H5_013108 [Mactra antiquata]
MSNMFWALILEAGKRYSSTVEQSFHISMAALQASSDSDSHKGKDNVSVMIASQNSEYLLCNLNSRNATQQPLDLNFSQGEEVKFFTVGPGTVHLTGYIVDDDDLGMFDEGDDEEEDEEEEVPQLVPARKRKSDSGDLASLKKKTKWLAPNELGDDDDDDDDSEDGDWDTSEFIDMEADSDDDDDDEEDDIDFEDEEEDDDDDGSDEEMEKKVKQTPKSEKKKQVQTPTMNGKKVEQNKAQKQQTPEQKKQQTPKPAQKEATADTPGPDGDQSAKKKKKKKKNKNKDKDGDQNKSVAGTPQPQKQQQSQQTPKQQQQTPKQQQNQGKTPQGKQDKGGKTPSKKVLAGGIIAEDIVQGQGNTVSKGKMAHVYYVGKLQKDGRQFDSCTSGKPFKFKLGKGEVIQGWDKGVEGMKIGGKRRLTIPPNQGYGNQRSGPIPPNSTLVFEVELKSVS